jgi:hypothetical protein
MPSCAASAGVPGRDERAGHAAAAADQRPRQGRRDPGLAPPDHSSRTATPRPRSQGSIRSRRPSPARGLLHLLPRKTLHQIRLMVRPDTVLRWHRDLIAARHARISRPNRVGRPRTVRSIRQLVLRLARKQHVGLSTHSRRTTRPRNQGRSLHRLGDPQRRRHRPSTAAKESDLGDVPTVPGRGDSRR